MTDETTKRLAETMAAELNDEEIQEVTDWLDDFEANCEAKRDQYRAYGQFQLKKAKVATELAEAAERLAEERDD